jgi:hypothetical protein
LIAAAISAARAESTNAMQQSSNASGHATAENSIFFKCACLIDNDIQFPATHIEIVA